MRPLRTLLRVSVPAVAAGLALAPLLVASPACVRATPQTPVITARWSDNFDRAQLGSDWFPTGPAWSIQDGHLHVQNAHNHPVWLKRRIPRNARIEFEAWSESPDGDLKCELWGDGHSYATEDEYTATSYETIFGGWRNNLNVISRLDEHGHDRMERRGPRVVQGQHYHWLVERQGNALRWSIDGEPMLEFDDASPLEGPGHDHFAFNDWAVPANFDNLVITPL